MLTGVKAGRKWNTAARCVLLIWLLVALTQQYPKVLQRGIADFSSGPRSWSLLTGASGRASPLLRLLDRLDSMDGSSEWRVLVILPLPVQFERGLGRFDEFSPAGLEHLAHEILQPTYLSFPRKVDIAFLDSHGNLLRVSHRREDRFIPRITVDLSQYEVVALAKDAQRLKLDGMEVVGETPDADIRIYKWTKL